MILANTGPKQIGETRPAVDRAAAPSPIGVILFNLTCLGVLATWSLVADLFGDFGNSVFDFKRGEEDMLMLAVITFVASIGSSDGDKFSADMMFEFVVNSRFSKDLV